MDGVHDMGGMHGFGPVPLEENEPVFHAEWERRAFGMVRAVGALGLAPIDVRRHSIENMPPGAYLSAHYYEKWLHGLETLLTQRGFLKEGEVDARVAELESGATPAKD